MIYVPLKLFLIIFMASVFHAQIGDQIRIPSRKSFNRIRVVRHSDRKNEKEKCMANLNSTLASFLETVSRRSTNYTQKGIPSQDNIIRDILKNLSSKTIFGLAGECNKKTSLGVAQYVITQVEQQQPASLEKKFSVEQLVVNRIELKPCVESSAQEMQKGQSTEANRTRKFYEYWFFDQNFTVLYHFYKTEKEKNAELQANLEGALTKIQALERDERKEPNTLSARQNSSLGRCEKNMSNINDISENERPSMTNETTMEVKEQLKNNNTKTQYPEQIQFSERNATKSKFEEGLFEKRFIIRRYFQMAWRALENRGLEKGEVSYNDKRDYGIGPNNVDWGLEKASLSNKTFWDQGATLISSLDTLYIMECASEYKRARDWVESSFSLTSQDDSEVFHVRKSVILYIGGFLSIYALTGDTLFRDKAIEIGEYLLPAFEIGGGFSCAWYHINHGCMLLQDEDKKFEPSAYASLNLEFELLSDVSGNEIFREKAKQIFKATKTHPQKLQSWFRNSVVMDNFKEIASYDWSLRPVSQSGGTYLDYLLKTWITGGRKNEIIRETYIQATEQAIQNLIKTSKGGLAYVTAILLVNETVPETMAHSTCYVGGNLALGGYALGEPFKSNHSALGEAIANTCHEAYMRSPTGLAGDLFDFSPTGTPEARTSTKLKERGYEYHPQPIETYFILWRLTHNPKYRQWGMQILDRMIAKLQNNDFNDLLVVGTLDVGANSPNITIQKSQNDNKRQPSYLLAETFKYLYLLFGEDSEFPFDQWVFNANGHPFPIKGTPVYQNIKNVPTTYHSLTTGELKERDLIKRIQLPRPITPNKRTLDPLIRKKLAIRNVALKFLKYINARANIQGTIAITPSLRSKPLQNAKRQGKPTAQWSNARDNDEFWGFDTFRIASLDTLFIMGMAKEYKEMKDKIVENFKKIEKENLLYLKKSMISHLGGLLSCYSLTGDGIFREKAIQITGELLSAYNATTGLPYSWFNLSSYSGIINVDEGVLESVPFSSLFIELDHLWHVTNLPIYQETNQRILKIVIDKKQGLTSMFRNAIPLDFYASNLETDFTNLISQSGGTYVEYLLKSWLLGDRKDDSLRQAFIVASKQVIEDLVTTSSGSLTYVGIKLDHRLAPLMAHSTCYVGGLLALGGAALGEPFKSEYMKVGQDITFTCQQFYNKSLLGVPPTLFDFNNLEPTASPMVSSGYQLTSGTIESYFIMYRLTHDPKYREWGWNAFEVIQKMYNSENNAYEGIRDTTLSTINFDGTAPGSYFLSETLKYLYLLFSDEDEFSLDEWVFNANGHPLPIKGLFNYP